MASRYCGTRSTPCETTAQASASTRCSATTWAPSSGTPHALKMARMPFVSDSAFTIGMSTPQIANPLSDVDDHPALRLAAADEFERFVDSLQRKPGGNHRADDSLRHP